MKTSKKKQLEALKLQQGALDSNSGSYYSDWADLNVQIKSLKIEVGTKAEKRAILADLLSNRTCGMGSDGDAEKIAKLTAAVGPTKSSIETYREKNPPSDAMTRFMERGN